MSGDFWDSENWNWPKAVAALALAVTIVGIVWALAWSDVQITSHKYKSVHGQGTEQGTK